MMPRISSRSSSFADGPWSLDFGDGTTATVAADRADPQAPVYRWSLGGDGLSAHGDGIGQRLVLLEMCTIVARHRAPAGLDLSELELQRAIREAESSAEKAVKVLRQVLRKRTGLDWSVRRGRGRRSEEITIKAPRRRYRSGSMTFADAALLAAVTGEHIVMPARGVVLVASTARLRTILRAVAGPAVRTERTACG